MKLKNLVFGALAGIPSLATAHPGHAAPVLHLHAGTPSLLNALDPSVMAIGLLVGSLLLAARLKNRP